jgi:hypothetical protein
MARRSRWRMLLAGSRLRDSSDSIVSIAHSLGYESEGVFSAAFKRPMLISSSRRGGIVCPEAAQDPRERRTCSGYQEVNFTAPTRARTTMMMPTRRGPARGQYVHDGPSRPIGRIGQEVEGGPGGAIRTVLVMERTVSRRWAGMVGSSRKGCNQYGLQGTHMKLGSQSTCWREIFLRVEETHHRL